VLTTVASFREPWEAYLFHTRLEEDGFLAFVVHAHHIGVNWPYSTALGGVKVQVPDGDAAEAREVFARCRSGAFRTELEALFGDLDDPRCPRCGAQDYSQRRPTAEIVFTLALMLFLPIPAVGWRRHCRACDMIWQEG
jgi:hypothetical protein